MADEDLKGARRRFIEGVSKPVISQLLDCLFEDGVLNDYEKDSILEDNKATADMARSLVDMVRKKGPDASKMMIDRLEGCDRSLHSQLFPTSTRPTQPERAAKVEQNLLNQTTPTVEELWEKKKNDPDTYPVTKTNYENRVALLITNIQFSDARMNRAGAEKDEENMSKVLSSFGYKVKKYQNLSAKDINQEMINFSKLPELKETDSVFVVIMSHGKRGVVLGVNTNNEGDDEFYIDNIYKHLDSKSCPALINKPKVIIIQACRGEEKGSVLVSDSVYEADKVPAAGGDSVVDDTMKFVHKEKDFIALLSCTPDTLSYRHKEKGSFLIQFLEEIFEAHAQNDHIRELFRKVQCRFDSLDASNRRQMPTIDRDTLLKHFYLYPGLSG